MGEWNFTEKGSRHRLLDMIQETGEEYAKCMINEMLERLRDAAQCISGKGVFGNRASEMIPYVGVEQIDRYLRAHGKDVLDFPCIKGRSGYFYNVDIVYHALHNPYIHLTVTCYESRGCMSISLEVEDKAREFIQKRLRAECTKDILGHTREELNMKYGRPGGESAIRYYAFEDRIEYRGLILQLVFDGDAVTSVREWL